MFFSVFCLTVASLSAQVTIGTGTSSLAYPFSAWYGYTRSASIYTAAEVTTNGTITHLGWYVGTAQSTSIPIKIYVKKNNVFIYYKRTCCYVSSLFFNG